mgnify:CR=1 FL=1
MDYMGIYVCGTVFVQISLGMNMFITSQGLSKPSIADRYYFGSGGLNI